MKDLSVRRLRELLHYDPETGVFTNAVTRHWKAPAGAVAGSKMNKGYIEIGIDGESYLAHRLAWLYMTGKFPEQLIDHRDGNGANNAWRNLRAATPRLNQQNMRAATASNKSTGLLGAYRVGRRFKSTIKVNGRPKHLGFFATPEEAHAAYVTAKRVLHEGCTI